MLALQIYLGLVLVSVLIVVGKLISHWLGGGFRCDPYPPEAAEAPTDDVMALADGLTPVIDAGHQMCDGPCCREERLDRLVAEFDWDRYKTWLKEPS